jgi:hypothetical protein
VNAISPRVPFEAGPDAHVNDRSISTLGKSTISPGLKIAGATFRTLFMCLLLVVIVLVARPQSETVLSAYETPGDLVRIALGLLAGIWILVHLFIPPREPAAYRTWLYLGLVFVPLAVVYAFVMW